MEKAALVLEGGGFRGVYTSGVLDLLMEQGLYFPRVYGVSAGACNATAYASRQPGRNARICFLFCNDPRYISYRNFMAARSAIGMDFIFKEIPRRYIPFDYHTFQTSGTLIFAGATNLVTGKVDYFSTHEMGEDLLPVQASSSVPLVCPPVEIGGQPYLDGGTGEPVPILRAMEDGCTRYLIVLTQDSRYRKTAYPLLRMAQRTYAAYPKLVELITRRHEYYNEQIAFCGQLERQGRAIILRPRQPVTVHPCERNSQKLKELYRWGYEDARQRLEEIRAFLQA